MPPESPPPSLLRVRADDPEYLRQAAAEADFWAQVHPLGLEATETTLRDLRVERHLNLRFTGDARVEWTATIRRWGTFRRGLALGTASLTREATILETNPHLHLTFLDISPGALERRVQVLGARFPGRVQTAVADLNFAELAPGTYDLVVSSSSIHHVINLEHLASQIDRTLTSDGYFFLEDYVGEPRFAFSAAKRRLFETVYNRDLARQRNRTPGLVWRDASDLSPFCGVRSDEILDVFRAHLHEVQVRTAAGLTIPLARSSPVDMDELWRNVTRRQIWAARLRQFFRLPNPVVDPRLTRELLLVGDVASDAGLIRPGVAFAVYRPRRAATT